MQEEFDRYLAPIQHLDAGMERRGRDMTRMLLKIHPEAADDVRKEALNKGNREGAPRGMSSLRAAAQQEPYGRGAHGAPRAIRVLVRIGWSTCCSISRRKRSPPGSATPKRSDKA